MAGVGRRDHIDIISRASLGSAGPGIGSGLSHAKV